MVVPRGPSSAVQAGLLAAPVASEEVQPALLEAQLASEEVQLALVEAQLASSEVLEVSLLTLLLSPGVVLGNKTSPSTALRNVFPPSQNKRLRLSQPSG